MKVNSSERYNNYKYIIPNKNTYIYLIKAPKYRKQKLTEIEEEIQQ